ncbi:hypothetical protein CUMW_252680 [Citrus unshiu]|uniref:Uncharacterized protein n=1 Tax=Citrus unshiu TaxID=55188 RepID=A0A2H5QQM8_CITUN|nr:hypothetical protein CUMW_252680 [Citrus unshiu]
MAAGMHSELGCTTGWVRLLTSPTFISGHPRHLKHSSWPRTTTGKLTDFGALICRHHRAWEVTAGTIGLTEEDPRTRINPRTLLIPSLDFVTIDSPWECRMGRFTLFAID